MPAPCFCRDAAFVILSVIKEYERKIFQRGEFNMITSKHYVAERISREYLIDYGIGQGHIVNDFVINRGHKDGPEIHILTSTGIVVIENYYTRKVVTKLIARPQQIQRYYAIIGEKAPEWLLMVAKRHCELGYNNI